mgnify:CR=1 FL=1
MSKKLCPRCEQGWVVPIRIVATEQTIQFCMECDAVWDIDVETLRADRYSEFGEDDTFWMLVPFLESQGLRYKSGSIENACPENEELWQVGPQHY